jgi:FtsZ-binding cell division protein ZapB
MIDSFKTITDLLAKCQQNTNIILPVDLKSQLETHQKEIITLQTNYKYKETELNHTIQTLTSELGVAKDNIFILQKEVDELKNKREILANDNKELGKLNTDYQNEITKQISLFGQLNQSIQSLKTKVGKFLNINKAQNKATVTYLPDTILAEIRQDVLKGNDFEFIKQFKPESDKTIIINTIKTKIKQKWISELDKIIEDLKNIKKNLNSHSITTLATQESMPLWNDYLKKLENFMTIWEENSNQFVWTWAKVRNSLLKTIL